MVVHLLVAYGLRLDPDPDQIVQLLVLIPLLALSLTLPVTVNGIGLRETVAELLLVQRGLAGPRRVAMEWWRSWWWWPFSLVGGVLWWQARAGSTPDGVGHARADRTPAPGFHAAGLRVPPRVRLSPSAGVLTSSPEVLRICRLRLRPVTPVVQAKD